MYSIGLDVSKSTINCYIPNGEIDLAIDNNEKSLNQFYGYLYIKVPKATSDLKVA